MYANDIIPLCGFTTWNAPLWFLYVMVFVGSMKPAWRHWKSYVPLVVFIALAMIVRAIYPNAGNALLWRNVLLGIICVSIGECLARYKIIEKVSMKRHLLVAILVVGSIIGIYNGSVSTYACFYGRSVWLLAIASFLVSVSLMAIFERYERVFPAWLGLLGRCSLFIMVSHYFVVKFFDRVLDKVLHADMISVLQGLVLGVFIVCAYLLYFKVLSWLKLNHQLPDYFGGFKI